MSRRGFRPRNTPHHVRFTRCGVRLKLRRELYTNSALIVSWCNSNRKGEGEKDDQQVEEFGVYRCLVAECLHLRIRVQSIV